MATSCPGARGKARCSGWVRVTSIQTGAMALARGVGIPLGALSPHPDAQALERARELHFLDMPVAEEAGHQGVPVRGQLGFFGPEHGHHFLFPAGLIPCCRPPGTESMSGPDRASRRRSRLAAPRKVATKRVAGRL